MQAAGRIQTRIDPKLKAETEAIFSEIGLSTGEAIRLFYKQVVLNSGLPFPVRVPNSESKVALEEARQSEKLKTFDSLEDFKKSLE